jgi:flagellar biosynthesis protein FlhA
MDSKKTRIAIGGFTVLIATILIAPLPAIILDSLLIINQIFALGILVIVLCSIIKKSFFSSLPMVLKASAIFNLVLNVSAARLILTRGAAFDGWIIQALVSSLIAGSNNSLASIVVSFVMFSLASVIMTYVNTRIFKASKRFFKNFRAVKQTAIETEFRSGIITEEEAIAQKNALQRELDNLNAMKGSRKFIFGIVKAGIFISIVTILAGTISGYFQEGTINASLKIYIPLSMGNGILFQIHNLLLLTAFCLRIHHRGIWYRQWQNNSGAPQTRPSRAGLLI